TRTWRPSAATSTTSSSRVRPGASWCEGFSCACARRSSGRRASTATSLFRRESNSSPFMGRWRRSRQRGCLLTKPYRGQRDTQRRPNDANAPDESRQPGLARAKPDRKSRDGGESISGLSNVECERGADDREDRAPNEVGAM